MALILRLVSGSSAKRPEPSGINAMPRVQRILTGQPWVQAVHDDRPVHRLEISAAPDADRAECNAAAGQHPRHISIGARIVEATATSNYPFDPGNAPRGREYSVNARL